MAKKTKENKIKAPDNAELSSKDESKSSKKVDPTDSIVSTIGLQDTIFLCYRPKIDLKELLNINLNLSI
jgi:hypothetical protein